MDAGIQSNLAAAAAKTTAETEKLAVPPDAFVPATEETRAHDAGRVLVGCVADRLGSAVRGQLSADCRRRACREHATFFVHTNRKAQLASNLAGVGLICLV
jgi:hypothetical protein